jgi:ABC-type antimicrobial peptide transport system permease subunit
VRGIIERYVEHLGRSLFLLFGPVGILLLIGCTNVSILLLARGTARQHELSVRSAIGASRWRIQRQLLTEALALSVLGAIGGVLLAYRMLPVLVRWLLQLVFASTAREVTGGLFCGVLLSLLLERTLSKWAEVSAQDPFLFAAATLLLVMTSALAAFIPALRASSVDPMIALRCE